MRLSIESSSTRAFLLAALLANSTADAQDQPGVFVHGLRQNGASWNTVTSQLAAEYRFAPYKPSYDWLRGFSTQKGQVNSQVPGGVADAFAIGYSNGGPLSRIWNRDFGRNDRIATIGAPNAGAPIAFNASRGAVFFWGYGIASSINSAVGFYYTYDWSRYFPVYVDASLEMMFGWGADLPDALAYMGYAAYPVTSVAAPILLDLSPTSNYFSGSSSLNSSANLTREAQVMQARVGIVGSSANDYDLLPYSLFGRDSASARRIIRWRQRAWSFSIYAYLHYANYWDPNDPDAFWLRSNAYRWAYVAFQMQDMDAVWCNLIGTLRPGDYVRYGAYGYSLNCADSDGLVPLASQSYPNFTNQRQIVPITHALLQTDSRTLNHLRETLGDDFEVPLRTAGSVSRAVVTPSTLQLAPSQTAQLSGKTYDYYGALLSSPISAWNSSAPSVASVSASGLVTAHSSGTAMIIATSNGYSDTAVTTVSAPSLAVSFNGPTSVPPTSACVWYAVVGGGVAPYSYVWYIDGSPTGSNDSFHEGAHPSGPFLLRVDVTDSANNFQSATLNVDVSSGAPYCLL